MHRRPCDNELPAREFAVEAARFDETLQMLRRRVPFRPFTVALINGDRFEVDDPRALCLREGCGGFIGPGPKPWIFDNESVSEIIAT